VGFGVGVSVGVWLGEGEGGRVVGCSVGEWVGGAVGGSVGAGVGLGVGASVAVGAIVGFGVGESVEHVNERLFTSITVSLVSVNDRTSLALKEKECVTERVPVEAVAMRLPFNFISVVPALQEFPKSTVTEPEDGKVRLSVATPGYLKPHQEAEGTLEQKVDGVGLKS